MAVSNEILTNRLDKKINYGVARTAYDSVKSPVQEAIGSPSPNPAHDLWIDSDTIPAAMPPTNTTDLLIYKYKSGATAGSAVGNSSGVIEMTLDTTVASGRSYLACSTLNDATTRLPGWVGFGMFGAQYLTKIVIATSGYHGQNFDLSGAGYYKVVQPGAGGYEFYFDVDAGVLVFAGTSGIPTELSSGRSIYLSAGARYRGRTGIKNYIDVDTSGNLTVSGNLIVAGTTTTQNTSTTVLSDPILTLGGNVALSTDDNKDRGIQFRWHDGTVDVTAGSFVTSTEYTITATGNTDFTAIGAADSNVGTVFTATGAGTGTGTANATANSNVGFFGYDDSAGNFAFIPDATDTSGVFTGTQGGFTGSEYIAYNLGSAPGTTTDKLYNVSGTLYWNGQTVATGTAVADLVGLTDTNITSPTDGQVIEYNTATSKWINAAAGGAISTLTEDIFTGDGTTVIFDVTNNVTAEANLLITVDGIVQPNSAWTLTNDGSGNPKRVTLSGAPLTGQTIRMLNIGISSTQTMVPSTGSVTPAMISSTLKNYHDDEFTTINASTVNFDCSNDLLSVTSIIVTIDGVTQPSTAFSLSTDAGGVNQRRVVLSVAPETGANIRVLNLGLPTTAPLASGVVNATHLANELKNFYTKTFTGDGTIVNYDMDYDILVHGRDLLVTVDGIVQTETTHYTIGNDGSGNQRRVIFGSAPITGTAIRIMHLGVVTSTLASQLVTDTTPQLGGNLDVNGKSIVSISNGNIAITPHGTGKVVIGSDLQVTGTTTTIDSTTINVQNAFVFEGTTADAFETTLSVIDPTADRTVTLPDADGTLVHVSSSTASIKVPSGTTAQRGTTATGAFRFNTTDTSFEGYDGAEWGAIGGGELAYTKETFTATANQTTFTLANKYTLGYIEVYLNGVKLIGGSGNDFTATSTSAPYTVVLTSGAALNDMIQTVAFTTFVVAQNTIKTETFTATASQTTFTPADPYTVGNVQVYLNGVKLLVGVDVTATNGTTIVLVDPADVGDAVQTVAYGTFASSDHYLKSETYTQAEVNTNNYTKTEHLALPSNILPDAHNTRDLGSNAVRWANVYAADVHLKNERGDWSMVEEEDYLTLINNKTGKRFKLLMEELD
jgi:hypothetical protein